MVRTTTFATDTNKDLTSAEDAIAGGLALQVSAISGATVTVRLSQNGSDYVTALMVPVGSATGVTSASAAGAWRVDCSGFRIVNISSASGTCTALWDTYRG